MGRGLHNCAHTQAACWHVSPQFQGAVEVSACCQTATPPSSGASRLAKPLFCWRLAALPNPLLLPRPGVAAHLFPGPVHQKADSAPAHPPPPRPHAARHAAC